MNARNKVLGTAAMALLTALAGSAYAMGDTDDTSTNARDDITNRTTYPTPGAATTAQPSRGNAQSTLPPTEPPAVLSSPEDPRYPPQTGDAEYGSRLNAERPAPLGSVTPPSRFNDATGQ